MNVDKMEEDDDYNFPFTAYSIQLSLMKHLTYNLRSGLITIIESPTGTGKSLSLISASLSWLNQFNNTVKLDLIQQLTSEFNQSNQDEPDWILQQLIKIKLDELYKLESELSIRLEKIRSITATNSANSHKKIKLIHHSDLTNTNHNQFAPDPYTEDDSDNDNNASDNYSNQVRTMMKYASLHSLFKFED